MAERMADYKEKQIFTQNRRRPSFKIYIKALRPPIEEQNIFISAVQNRIFIINVLR
jgi:hypothetical protein